jgi:hypothetical protein
MDHRFNLRIIEHSTNITGQKRESKITFQFLAHLTWRVIWAIAITWHPSSVVNISIFSSETIGPFGTKLGRNIPWVDLYKVFIFGWSNLKHGRQGQLCVLIGWNFKDLFWNRLTNWTEICWEWWGDRPLQRFVGFLSIGNSRWQPPKDIVYHV